MARYIIKYDMGFCGTESDFEEIEIQDGEDPETSPEILEAISEAYADAITNVSAWYELSDDE